MSRSRELVSRNILTVSPREARLDVSSLCQLECVRCPVRQRGGRFFIGRGVMALGEFVRFVEKNPQIRVIELGNSGEVFLNPELPELLRWGAEKKLMIRIAEGVNLNDASEEMLEALVKYRVTMLRVAMDGVTQETYAKYRVGGMLKNVLANVQRINEFKKKHGSDLPRLILQFVPFAHNEHELGKVIVLARMMGMEVDFRLNTFPDTFPLRDPAALTRLLGYADKTSYLKKTGHVYMREVCLQFWRAPQVNWDGRLLGCSANTNVNFADYVLDDSFAREINNEPMRYVRRMLIGEAPPRDDMPCSGCKSYADLRRHGQWFRPDEIRAAMWRNYD
jgi:hypothetical protein